MENMFFKQTIGVNMKKKLKQKSEIPDTTKLVNSYLGYWCEVGPYSLLQNTEFKDYSYSGSNCIFQNTIVGKFSNIAAYVRIGATDHPMQRPSLHHFTYRSFMYGFGEDDEDFFKERISKITSIGHDTWIGHGSLIKAGVKIGNGAVIGQGSVVAKDVLPYSIVAGVPAKLIRYRFKPEVIEAIEKIEWWNWSKEKLQNNYMDFRKDVNSFIKKHSGKEGKN
jgi:phosphonate metabolism protein (transferase hexapeptide repeat family)